MRAIGEINNEAEALRFGDYLYANGIANDVEPDGDGWTIWIHDDDIIAKAEKELANFQKDAADSRYTKAGSQATKLRQKEAKENERASKRQVDVRTQVFGRVAAPPRLTQAIIAFCVIIHVLSLAGGFEGLRNSMMLSEVHIRGKQIALRCPHCQVSLGIGIEAAGAKSRCSECKKPITIPKYNLPELRRGEVWRLFGSAFLHSTNRSSGMFIMHILFNMWWFLSLAGMMEQILGKRYMLTFVLLTAFASTFAEYLFNTPFSVGMSGVVYALFGYTWMRSRLEPGSKFFIDPSNAMILMVWFVLCFLGFFGGNIANFAHAGGLASGAAWGWLAARRAMRG